MPTHFPRPERESGHVVNPLEECLTYALDLAEQVKQDLLAGEPDAERLAQLEEAIARAVELRQDSPDGGTAGAVAESVAELAGLLEQALQGGQTWLVCASSEHLQEMALGEQMRRAYREPRR